jgi:hypothetical protein
MAAIFGTQENFEKYQVSRLLREQAGLFQKSKRLVLSGYGNFQKHFLDSHALLDALGIQYAFINGPARKHIWESGWIPDTVSALVEMAK